MKIKQQTIIISILFIALFISHTVSLAQKESTKPDTTIYLKVDIRPILITEQKEYKTNELIDFISKNITWPNTETDCFGSVYISFIVEPDGSISNQKFIRKLYPEFDSIAMSIIDKMKYWKPGEINGTKVRTKMVLPVRFSMGNPDVKL